MKFRRVPTSCLILAFIFGCTSTAPVAPVSSPVATPPPPSAQVSIPTTSFTTAPTAVKTTAAPATRVPSAPPAARPTTPPAEGGSSIGDTQEVSGEQRITLSQAEVTQGSSEFFKPGEGKIFAALLFRIEGIAEGASYNPFYFTARDQDGFEYNYTPFGNEPVLSSGDLAPGEAVQGWVNFEVPDDFETLQVEYNPSFGFGDSVVFRVRAPD